MRPTIFIGSSTEGLPIAKLIKNFFDDEFECHTWDEDVFKFNVGIAETLLTSASLHDIGFMVFTADDASMVRGRRYITPRDNVLFEYGLFLGKLGIERAYIIAEEGVKIPTDLSGINILFYQTRKIRGKRSPKEDFQEKLNDLKKQICEKAKFGYLGLLPSTVIAITYFDNFIKPLAGEILQQRLQVEIKGIKCNPVKIKIIVPQSICEDMKSNALIYYKSSGFVSCTANFASREYNFYAGGNADGSTNTAVIVDMPTILSGIYKAIDIYLRDGHVGTSEERRLTEEHEICAFARVLKILISQDPCCKEFVEIVRE